MIKPVTDVKTNWDLTVFFNGISDPKIEENLKNVKNAADKFSKKWQKNNQFLSDSKVLKAALDEYNQLFEKFGLNGEAGYYLELYRLIDQNNTELQARYNQVDEFGNNIFNQLQFFKNSLAKVPLNVQKKFLSDKTLTPYKHFLEKLFIKSKYLLSDEAEKVLNLRSATSYDQWVDMVQSFLSKEEREIIIKKGEKKTAQNISQIMGLVSNPDKEIRDEAAAALNDILNNNKVVAEKEINAILMHKKVEDELRGYSRADKSRLINDDIEEEMVDTLVRVVSSYYSISKKFYKFKAQLFGLSKLAYHERNIEYGVIDKEYKYEEGFNLVYKAFNDLDPEFAEILKYFNDHSQIDVFPKTGKRGGAVCFYNLASQPSFVLTNYNNKLYDVLTLAHESGHGINNELMRKKQPALSFGTPKSTAEIASIVMEDFVLQEILKEADDELKLAVMVMRINNDVSAAFRQIAFYKFEQDLHQKFREKGYLSYQEIGELFQKHMKSYMGPAVEQSPGSENWWVSWIHLRYYFYVYSYAGGVLVAKSLQNSIKEDHSFVKKLKYFLSAGTSESPRQIFKNIGIDLHDEQFWIKGIKEIDANLNEAMMLAKKLGKI